MRRASCLVQHVPQEGVTYFGHDRFLANKFSRFGHDLLWARPTLATTCFGHGLTDFWPRSVLGIYEGEEGEEGSGRAREWGGGGGWGPEGSGGPK